MPSQDQDFHIDVSRDGSIETVTVRGEIDLDSAPRLRDRLHALIDMSGKRVIVDLAAVRYMDSSGVGTLVEFKRKLEKRGGRVVLCGLQPLVRGVLEVTQLDKFFSIANSADEARAL